MFRFACSVVLWEEGALQTNVTGLCGEHSQCSGHIGFAPAKTGYAFPSTLLRLLAALYGAGPALPAVPVFGYSTKAQTQLHLRFVPSPARAAQAARSLTGALSPGSARLLPSAVPASGSACASRVHAPPLLHVPSPSPCPGWSGVCTFSPPQPQPQFPLAPVECMHLEFSCDPRGGCQPSRISGSLWLQTGGLFAVW